MLDKADIFIGILLMISIILLIFTIYYSYTYMYECYDIDGNVYYANSWEIYHMQLYLPNGVVVKLKSTKLIKRAEVESEYVR